MNDDSQLIYVIELHFLTRVIKIKAVHLGLELYTGFLPRIVLLENSLTGKLPEHAEILVREWHFK